MQPTARKMKAVSNSFQLTNEENNKLECVQIVEGLGAIYPREEDEIICNMTEVVTMLLHCLQIAARRVGKMSHSNNPHRSCVPPLSLWNAGSLFYIRPALCSSVYINKRKCRKGC